MKKRISFLFRLVSTILLASFALYKAGLLGEDGREKFINLLFNVRWEFVIASVLLMFILNFSSSLKWYMLLKSKQIQISIWRVYVYYGIGRFFNLILPTSMGGDVVRIFQLGKYTGRKHTAAASVIVERFSGLIVLMLMSITAVILNLKVFNQIWLSVALFIGFLALTAIIWIILDFRIFEFFQKRIGNKFKIIAKVFNKLDKIRQTIIEFKSDKNAMTWAIINSIIFQLLAVLNVWITSKAFSEELSLITCLAAVPVILFIMNIPFSIGGIGLMEFGYVFTLSLFGVSPSLSISTALLIRTKGIFDALLGGIFYLSLNGDKSLAEEIKNQENKTTL